MKNKEILISKLLFFMFIGTMGSFGSFINLHLEQVVGLSGTQIGFVTFLGLIATVIMNPIWGYIADKTGKHIFLLKMSFLAATVIGAFYYGARTFTLVVISVILLESMRAPIMALLEYLSTNYSEKYNYEFGKIRVFASWGFLIIAVTTGFLVGGLELELFGNSLSFDGVMTLEFATFGIFIILNTVAVMLLFFLPKSPNKVPVTTDNTKKSFDKNDVRELLTNKKFLMIIILTMIGFVTVDAVSSYSTMHLVTVLEASENIVSWLALFTVTPELILLPLGTMLMTKFGFKNWYIFTLITMILRLTLYSFTLNPTIFVLGGIVHALMMVMHTIGTIMYIRKVVLPKSLGLALTILASTMALSRAILSFMFGWIYENIDSFTMFRVAAIIVFLALFLALNSKNLKEVGNEMRL